ncbi:MAG TPA: serine hydrolase domain-containing protein [Bryobacteraceae bacterium]
MKRVIGILLFAISALLAATPPQEPATDLDTSTLAKIRPRLQEFIDQGTAAGFVTLVAHRGHVASLEAIGWQDRDSRTSMRTTTLFQIMSMTKPITCATVMTLVDEGRISINDPVEKYLPEFKGQKLKSGGAPDHPITIRELMTHTSGLASGSSAGFDRRAHTLAEVVADAAGQPLGFEPGTKWSYSNNGIGTLGRILEVVSGKSYEQFVEERIFKPLGMKDTVYWMPQEKVSRLATAYTLDHGTLKVAEGDPLRKGARYPSPEGGLYSTASDLFRFYQMMLNKGTFGGRRVLSLAAVELMTTVQTGDLKTGFAPGIGYGLGWGIVRDVSGMFRYQSIGTYGHGGAYRTYAFVDPHRQLIGIILYQRTNVGGDLADEQTAFIELANAAVQ